MKKFIISHLNMLYFRCYKKYGGIRLKKLIFIFSFFTVFSFVATTKVHAGEDFSVLENSVSYNLEQGGLQQFEVENEFGEEYTITIEEQPHLLRAVVSNGTYKITKERALQWKVSYKIDVKGNNITRAHSPSITNYIGNVTSSSLKIDNAKQATYYIKMKILTINSSVNIRAKLQNDKILVTY